MKTITIDDEIYRKLSIAKTEFNARSFSEVLKKILSEDRISWVSKLAGKMKFDKKKLVELNMAWEKWNTQ
jgi:predicted CopG family antitoxin